MAEPDRSAGVDASGELDASIDVKGAGDPEEAAASDGDGEETTEGKAPEPPRRRLVAELLEGQDALEESSRPGLQLVAPPLHPETIDAGQPIYQLDLSSEEPQGVLVEPERPTPSVDEDLYDPRGLEGADAGSVIKNMIMQRDRRVMLAERDGIGAYELAANLESFVAKILDIARRLD